MDGWMDDGQTDKVPEWRRQQEGVCVVELLALSGKVLHRGGSVQSAPVQSGPVRSSVPGPPGSLQLLLKLCKHEVTLIVA